MGLFTSRLDSVGEPTPCYRAQCWLFGSALRISWAHACPATIECKWSVSRRRKVVKSSASLCRKCASTASSMTWNGTRKRSRNVHSHTKLHKRCVRDCPNDHVKLFTLKTEHRNGPRILASAYFVIWFSAPSFYVFIIKIKYPTKLE